MNKTKIKTLFALMGLLGIGSPSFAQPTLNGPLRVPKGRIIIPQSAVPQGTPQLDVKPNQTGGPVSTDLMTNLQKLEERLQTLETQNAELKKRVATLEGEQTKMSKDVLQHNKDMLALKLIVPNLDKALGKTNSDLADFKLEYSKHSHQTNFTYESFKFLTETPGNNKGNFFIPYVWLNSKPGLSQIEKEKSVQPYLNKTTPPTDK